MYRVTTQLNETGINHVCLWRIDSIGMSVESYTRLFVLSRHCTVLRTAWTKNPLAPSSLDIVRTRCHEAPCNGL